MAWTRCRLPCLHKRATALRHTGGWQPPPRAAVTSALPRMCVADAFYSSPAYLLVVFCASLCAMGLILPVLCLATLPPMPYCAILPSSHASALDLLLHIVDGLLLLFMFFSADTRTVHAGVTRNMAGRYSTTRTDVLCGLGLTGCARCPSACSWAFWPSALPCLFPASRQWPWFLYSWHATSMQHTYKLLGLVGLSVPMEGGGMVRQLRSSCCGLYARSRAANMPYLLPAFYCAAFWLLPAWHGWAFSAGCAGCCTMPASLPAACPIISV